MRQKETWAMLVKFGGGGLSIREKSKNDPDTDYFTSPKAGSLMKDTVPMDRRNYTEGRKDQHDLIS